MDKTANEQGNSQFVKYTEIESFFNIKEQVIKNDVQSSSYAIFVEQLEKTQLMDERNDN